MSIAQLCQAGLSGRSDTLMSLDNREFQSKGTLEQRLNVKYDDPASGLRSGLSLLLRERNNKDEGEIYQFYVEKALGDRNDLLRLGRFEQADALGFYVLDGARLKLSRDIATWVFYSGVPHRIEGLRSIEGERLHGLDLYLSGLRQGTFIIDGRIGWQGLEQETNHERLNFGLTGRRRGSDQAGSEPYPYTLSMAGSYLPDERLWESYQVKLSAAGFSRNTRLRLDYESYEPSKEQITFRERFYSLYGRGRQSQLKLGYHIGKGKDSWSLSGRRVIREVGDEGYGQAIRWRHRDGRGMQIETQLDHQSLSEDSATSFYSEMARPLTVKMRGVLSGVLQWQQKRLAGDNRAAGLEMRLERMIRIDASASGLRLSTQLSHIWNSRLQDEYRIAVELSYRFDDRIRESE